MRRTMIVTVETDDSDHGRFAMALMQGALMSYINHIERAGYARDANGAMRATFCDQPLADTTIDKLARATAQQKGEPFEMLNGDEQREETNEPRPSYRNRLRRGPLSLR